MENKEKYEKQTLGIRKEEEEEGGVRSINSRRRRGSQKGWRIR